MNGEAIVAVSSAVVALTQLIKWAGMPDSKGPIAVMGLSLMGVALYIFSSDSFSRNQIFSYFAAWIAVSTAAAGIFGFTRAASSAITSTKEPPPGAGSSRTTP